MLYKITGRETVIVIFFIISIIMLYTPCRSLNTFLQIMAQFDQILKNEERLS